MSDELVAPKKRSRKLYILWAIALTILLTVGLFCWLVVVPFCRVSGVIPSYSRSAWPSSPEIISEMMETITLLGGPEEAAYSLRVYIAAPEGIAPRKWGAVQLLRCCGRHGVPVLVRVLRSPDAGLRGEACRSLAAIGPDADDAVPALGETLSDPSRKVRYEAAKALAKTGAAAAPVVPELTRALRDPSDLVRHQSILALENVGAPAAEAEAELLKCLDAEYLRLTAARALIRIGTSSDRPKQLLLDLLRSESPRDRHFAAMSLGNLGSLAKWAVPHLVAEAKRDAHSVSRESAVVALGEIGDAGQGTLRVLRELAADKDMYIREAAAEALKKIKAAQEKK